MIIWTISLLLGNIYEVENDKLKDLNIAIPNKGFISILDIIPIRFDRKIDMNSESINRYKYKECIKSEIINNPKVVEDYWSW